MRKEFLGPLPLALGIVILASALLVPARAPAPPCQCPVYSAAEFEALDRGGYAGVAAGTVLVVDGRVAELTPGDFASHPYRVVRFEGSAIRFNVTDYDVFTGPIGGWTRITTTHSGQSEASGPDAGHRWSYGGKTAPSGASLVSLGGIALAIAVAAWGASTWKTFGQTRERAASLGGRIAEARAAREKDPAARTADALRAEIDSASSMVRRGQFDSATTTLEGIEAQLRRAVTLGERLEAAKAGVEKAGKAGFNAAPLGGVLADAERMRSDGNVPDAERVVGRVEVALASLPRAQELIATAAGALEANRAQLVEDIETSAALEDARRVLAEGLPEEALLRATRAVERAREVSPGARAAAAEISALKDFLLGRPEFDRAREVRDRVRDADELFHLGQLERAQAEARVGLWLADPNALGHAGFAAIARKWFESRGFEIDPKGAREPPQGFLAAKDGVHTLVVTSPWRDFPSERIVFAAKDFIRECGAQKAVLYSSAFTNTSTDERIRVVEVGELVTLLREAALAEVVGSRAGARGGE